MNGDDERYEDDLDETEDLIMARMMILILKEIGKKTLGVKKI